MNIRGINKFTLVDYPGEIACIIFVGNCNFVCPYCHNPFLVVDPDSQQLISESEFLTFLKGRKGKLDAVVISGGEPTLRKDLFIFSQKIKEMGFLIKLDTNGSNPRMIEKLHSAGYIDYLSIDYKYPLNRYSEVVMADSVDPGLNVQKAISYAVDLKIKYDIRTTVHKAILSPVDLNIMRKELIALGVKEWMLQQFNPVDVLDEKLLDLTTYSDAELKSLAENLPSTSVRGLKTT